MALFRRKKQQVPEVIAEVVRTLPTPPETLADGRRALTDQRDYLLSLIDPLPPFGMKTLDAVGLSLCEDLLADQDIPGVDVAQCEGYAVRAGDVASASIENPVSLPVAARLRLGEQVGAEVPSGVCVRVVAGSPMPDGTSAVVPLQEATESDGVAHVTLGVQPGQYVRAKGTDIRDGETLLRKGERLTSRMVGLLAGGGIDRVLVRPRPRVVVLATGAELVEPGLSLRVDSDAYDVTSYLLAAAARAEDVQVFRVGAYTRNPEKLREVLTDQLIRADLVVTSGGLTSAESDLLREVIPQMGMTDFCEVAVSPAATIGFGLIGYDDTPIVMVPGEPFAAYAAYQTIVRPILRLMMGQTTVVPPTLTATTRSMLRSQVGETGVFLGRLEDDGQERYVEILQGYQEHQLGALAEATCLVIVGPGAELVPAGSEVEVLPLD